MRDGQGRGPAGRRPTVVSLFAGGGGSSLGYLRAGFEELAAVERDAHACECLRENFPDVRVIETDVQEFRPEDLGLRPEELDLLDGSPPCQGFSNSGRRRPDDKRNRLWEEYVRILEGLRPRALLLENVPGMIQGRVRVEYLRMVAAIRAAGYRVRGTVMNASHFGTPQARRRVIVVGIRRDLGVEPSHPRPAVRPLAVARALGPPGLDPPNPEQTGSDGDCQYARGETLDLWTLCRPGESFSTVHPRGHLWDARKLHPRRPAPTVKKSFRAAGGIWHWAEPRTATIGELKRICGFPDSFVLRGSVRERWARLGNFVPPPLIEALARHIAGLIR